MLAIYSHYVFANPPYNLHHLLIGQQYQKLLLQIFQCQSPLFGVLEKHSQLFVGSDLSYRKAYHSKLVSLT